MCLILAWTAFAFGGVYPGALAAPAALLGALALVCRPRIHRRAPAPHLDLWLLVAIGAMALQAVPLPRTLLALVAPQAEPLARTLRLLDPTGPLPISIDVTSTAWATAIFAAAVLLFFTCRQIFAAGGVRAVVRWIALVGLVLSAIGLAQDATAKGLMYWRWPTIDQGPAPFGPFVNRNHFATWAIMAVPLSIGYLAAHGLAHRGAHPYATWQRRLVQAIDARAVLLVASAATSMLAVAASLSRSGLIGLAAALWVGALFARRKEGAALTRSTRPAIFIIALAAIAAGAVLTLVGPAAVVDRFAASDVALAGRGAIWQDALSVVRRFWPTGIGAGAFEMAMAAYQRNAPGVIFNQAHNHYLQLMVEGGLLVAVPVALAALAFCRTAAGAMQDRSGMYWVRAGAAAGLSGVAVQSVFETGLTTPANAALAAVLAAILVHAPDPAGPGPAPLERHD